MLETYLKSIDVAITICDINLNIIYMNEKSKATFPNANIGDSLIDCHKESSILLMKKLITEGKSNSYSIEKNGVKKIIHQTPWIKNDKISGLIEFSIVVPLEMPHFKRD